METMGELIRRKRKEHQYTMQEIGDMLHVYKQTIYKYEKDEVTIPSDKLFDLMRILEIKPSEIIPTISPQMSMPTSIEQAQYITDSTVRELNDKIIAVFNQLTQEDQNNVISYAEFLLKKEGAYDE